MSDKTLICGALSATTLTQFCIYGIAETFPDGKAMTELSLWKHQ
jgi:hypothetical protein